jgi:hypothetical protein
MSGEVVGWAMKQITGSPAAKLVLAKLADNANEQGLCWPSIDLIVLHTELGQSTVYKHLSMLEHLGLIKPVEIAVRGVPQKGFQLAVSGADMGIPPRRKPKSAIPPRGKPQDAVPPDGNSALPRGKEIPPRGTPYKDEPSVEPSSEPSLSRAREGDDAPLKAKPEKPASRYPEGFERFWTEVRNHWPGDWAANKHAAANAWGVLLASGDLRAVGDMVAAARNEGRNRQSAADQAAKRHERPPYAKVPANWLVLKCFEGLLDEPAAKVSAVVASFEDLTEGKRVTISLEHVDALRRQGLSDVEIAENFWDAELLDEPPMLRAGSQFRMTHISKRYGRQLAAVLRVAPEEIQFDWRREKVA